MNLRTFLLFLLLPIISSCLTRQQNPPPPQLDALPQQFSAPPGSIDLSTEWWKDLDSKELNTLMSEAVNKNFSLREAYARMSQAHFAALKAGSAQWPALSASSGAGHTDRRSDNNQTLGSDNWTLALSASYEIDLWGRVQAEITSEDLLANASAEDTKAALLSVSGQVAENWITLISTRQQQQLFQQQLELQRELLQLILLRFPLAKATALDIYQQQQAIEKLEAALIPLTSKEKTIKRQLAFLLGKARLDNEQLQADQFPALPEIPGVGLPADLLDQRPDILAAGMRLAAGQHDITVAKADLLPTLKLTASHTYSSDGLSSLFDNWLRNLAANMVAPLLDGKRRRNEVERVRVIAEERLAAYGRVVFTAIREVEDALADELQYHTSIASLNRQQELSDRTIREARTRYLNGGTGFLNVLKEELNVLQVKQDLITSEEKMMLARIRLHKALGGSWMSHYLKKTNQVSRSLSSLRL
ncbi:MAG: TolC family protein [Proteobacteria bacterium]|nr:TolC family protein [Desulfobulbaceae bacterium]MBU4152647.1 TolC family protein [Pseudomonadota bacterium]